MFRKISRVRMGAVLLALTFLPFLPLRLLPEFWATVPDWVRWGAYTTGGLACLGLVALVFTADYGTTPEQEEG
ncbi:MAG TPA: hypothetical protein VG940_12240 [Gemmatimonadales bacterium]|nr:hypothetical protein [Gemmatimonadales bacterium]